MTEYFNRSYPPYPPFARGEQLMPVNGYDNRSSAVVLRLILIISYQLLAVSY